MHDLSLLTDLVVIFAAAVLVVLLLVLEAQLLCASILSMIATHLLLAVAPRFVSLMERVRLLRAAFGHSTLASGTQ